MNKAELKAIWDEHKDGFIALLVEVAFLLVIILTLFVLYQQQLCE